MGTLRKFPIHTVHELADRNQSGICPMLVSEIRDTVGFNMVTHGSFEVAGDLTAWDYTSANSVTAVSSLSFPTSGPGIDFTDNCCRIWTGRNFNGSSDNIYGDGTEAICAISTTDIGYINGVDGSFVDGTSAVIDGTVNFDGVYVVSGAGPTSFRFSSSYSGYETPPSDAVVRNKVWSGRLWKNITTAAEVPMSLSTGRIYRLVAWCKPTHDRQRVRASITQFVGLVETVIHQVETEFVDSSNFVSSWRKIESEFTISTVAGVVSHAVRLESDLEVFWDDVSVYEVAASLDSMGSELADRKAIDAIPSGVTFVSTGDGVSILDHSISTSAWFRPVSAVTPDNLSIYMDGNNVCLSGQMAKFDIGQLPHWLVVDFADYDLNAAGSIIVYHSLGSKIVQVAVGRAYANGEVFKMEPDYVKFLSESFVEINVRSNISYTATPNRYKAVIGLPGRGAIVEGVLTYPYSGGVSGFVNSDIGLSGSIREFVIHHHMNLSYNDNFGVSEPLDILPVVVSDGYNQRIIPDFVNYLDENTMALGFTSFGKYWLANEIVDVSGRWNVAVGNLASGVSGYFSEFTSGDLMRGNYSDALSAMTFGTTTSGKLYVNHNLDQMLVPVTVVDDTFTRLGVNEYNVRYINNNICEIDLRDYIGKSAGMRIAGTWGVLVGSVVSPVWGTGSVQGGKSQFFKRFDFSASSDYASGGTWPNSTCAGYMISTSSESTADTVIGKVFARCFDALGEDGSTMSVGTTAEPERFIKQFTVTETFTGQVNWLEYGHHVVPVTSFTPSKVKGLIVDEYDYMTTAEPIYLFRYANPNTEVQDLFYPYKMSNTGNMGVSVFHDKCVWAPHYGYMFPGDSRPVMKYDPVDSLATNLASYLSDGRQATSCVRGSSSSNRHMIYNAGGIGHYDVDPSYPEYFPSLENAPLSNRIDMFNSKIDLAKATYRAALSTGKFAMGTAGNGIYGYFYGGAKGNTVGKAVSSSDVEKHNQTNDTVMRITPSAPTVKHATAGAFQSINIYFAGGVMFETPDYQNIPELDTIDQYSTTTDVATTLPKHKLSTKRYGCAGLNGNSTYAFFVSGRYRTNVDEMILANGTISTLSKPVIDMASAAATQDESNIYMFGGFPYYDPGLETDIIQKMVMSNGTWSVVDGTLPVALSRTNGINV